MNTIVQSYGCTSRRVPITLVVEDTDGFELLMVHLKVWRGGINVNLQTEMTICQVTVLLMEEEMDRLIAIFEIVLLE